MHVNGALSESMGAAVLGAQACNTASYCLPARARRRSDILYKKKNDAGLHSRIRAATGHVAIMPRIGISNGTMFPIYVSAQPAPNSSRDIISQGWSPVD